MVKPTHLPEWATNPLAVKTRPLINRREFGYSIGDKPSSNNWNWQFNNLYEWIKHFDDAGLLPYYTSTSGITSLNGADLSNNSFYLVKDKGVYRYDNSLSYITDDTYILAPDDNIGRFILFLADPNIQDNRTNDILGGLTGLYVDTLSFLSVGMTNFKYPASINYPISNRLVWVGNVVTVSSLGGEFWGGSANVVTPAQTATNTHLVGLRGWGLDETAKQITTGSRFTIQTTENMSTSGTGSRFVWFTNANASISGSSTALLLEQDRKLTTQNNVKPNTTNTHNLGEPSLVYSNIYLQNAPVVVSDERIKKDINQIDINKSFALFDKLTEKNAYIQFKFKDTEYQEEIYKTIIDKNGQMIDVVDRVENKVVKGNRFHFGLSAQKLVNSMLEVGINTSDCSIIHIENYKQGDELKVYDEDTGRLTVAYSEFVPLLIQTIDNLNKRVIELENFIGEME